MGIFRILMIVDIYKFSLWKFSTFSFICSNFLIFRGSFSFFIFFAMFFEIERMVSSISFCIPAKQSLYGIILLLKKFGADLNVSGILEMYTNWLSLYGLRANDIMASLNFSFWLEFSSKCRHFSFFKVYARCSRY